MLVLSRKLEESVVVLGAVGMEPMLRVTVLECRNGNVRLGFEADADVLIHRSEVWERGVVRNGSARPKVDPTAPVA